MDATWFVTRAGRILVGFALAVAMGVFASDPVRAAAASIAPAQLREVVVTATRVEEAADDLPYATVALTRTTFDERSPRTLPDALREESSVMVQKTALGQGSPFIRGFTGFRTVLLVDGFRLNNSVYRDGPNQYWNTVDAWSLERLEVVKGPTSAQYGSDAVGGIVHARTIASRFEGSVPIGFASASYRFSSAEDSHVGRVEAGAAIGAHTGVAVGGTWKTFGDLQGGRDVGVQPKTGYDEADVDLKFERRFENAARLTVAHQTVRIDDAWRTHATIHGLRWRGTVPASNLFRVLDQGRHLTYARLDVPELRGPLEALHAGVAHHRQTEDEFRQRSNLRMERQGFDVNTIGGFAHGHWTTRTGRWVAGAEFYRDSVDTFLREFDATGALAAVRVQGPVADDATHDLLGVFAEHRMRLSPRLEATVGGRLNSTRVDAGKVATPGTTSAFSLETDTTVIATNGRMLLSLDPAARWKAFAGASQGVRSPNLSDLTRFDIAEAGQIETPVSQLDPEQFLTGEIGVRADLGRGGFEFAYYHTRIDRLIVRTPTGRMVSGLAEVTKRNSGEGYIHGVELEGHARLTEKLSVNGVVSWMKGSLKSFPTAAPVLVKEPVSRLMPATFVGTVRWQEGPWWIAATTTIAERADGLNTQDRIDVERIPPGGTPGYAIMGLRAGWKWRSRLTLSAALENLTSEDYRIHGSGLNEPGRNLVLMARVDF